MPAETELALHLDTGVDVTDDDEAVEDEDTISEELSEDKILGLAIGFRCVDIDIVLLGLGSGGDTPSVAPPVTCPLSLAAPVTVLARLRETG